MKLKEEPVNQEEEKNLKEEKEKEMKKVEKKWNLLLKKLKHMEKTLVSYRLELKAISINIHNNQTKCLKLIQDYWPKNN